jgi:perosamine synthetase
VKKKIPLFKTYWDKEDVDSVSSTIESGMNWATGPNVQEFERQIAEYADTEYALVFSSGTSALHAALLAHGIGKSDEVIVPSFTFISTANSALFVGAKPVFADIEEETFGLEPDDVEEEITKKTKAIVPVHYGGCSCRIKELTEIAEDHGLLLIEDAAESLGATVDGKKIGSFGDSAMFSFCANKILSTGEGGAIVTDTKDVYERLKLIRSHGRLESEDYFASAKQMDYVSLGYNFRLSNILATLGVSQMKKVEKVIAMRRKNATLMSKELAKTSGLRTPIEPRGYRHVYQLYTILLENKRLRDELMKHLVSCGIGCKVYFSPIHLTKFYKEEFGHRTGELPNTEDLSQRVLTLPMHPMLKDEEIRYITDEIKSFLSE